MQGTDLEGIGLFIVLAVVISLPVLWYMKQRGKEMAALPEMYCTSCGNIGPPTSSLRGSSFMTFLLIWFMIIPAIAYSIWRHSGPRDRCALCGKATVIPLTSPIAQKALKDSSKEGIPSTASSLR